MLPFTYRCLVKSSSSFARLSRRYLSTAASNGSPAKAGGDPLRILFCGSDAFSCASLRALHREHTANSRLIEALDVMVLPGKRTGRGLKQIRQVPCKSAAEELGLKIHERETFRNWELPTGTNLVVVVSFGLFVPPRILTSAKYGGLNVHPSFLPDLRGPAPIHHAMLRGDSHIGVSLQTLDDKQFDHGTVLAQTPLPGIPISPGAGIQSILEEASQVGARMLVQGLRDGVHIPPRVNAGQWRKPGGEPLTHAPKVTKADARIDWTQWTSADEFVRRVCALGSVWTHAVDDKARRKRLIWLDAAPSTAPRDDSESSGVVTFFSDDGHGSQEEARRDVVMHEETGTCAVCVGEGAWVRVERVKVESQEERPAARALKPFLRSP